MCARKRSYASSVAPELLTMVIFVQTAGRKMTGRRFCKCRRRSWRLKLIMSALIFNSLRIKIMMKFVIYVKC